MSYVKGDYSPESAKARVGEAVSVARAARDRLSREQIIDRFAELVRGDSARYRDDPVDRSKAVREILGG